MALTKSEQWFTKTGSYIEYGVLAGAINIYQSAILNKDATGTAYVKLGSDTASEVFAGIATQELIQSAGGSNGDNIIRVLKAGSGESVKLKVTTGSLTKANIGTKVYVDGDDAVDFVGGVTNNVYVGVIDDIYDANYAWVKLVYEV